MKVVYWGTYDKGKPRNRIMLRGLRMNGVQVIECHSSVWNGVEDKTKIQGWRRRIKIFLHWLFSYPGLLIRYLKIPHHDYVIVGYMGHLDILLLWPFARLKGVPIVWDAFLSLYNTVVDDRKILSKINPVSKLIFGAEWLACRLAACVILDTNAHGNYFAKTFHVSSQKIRRIFVGAEETKFYPSVSGKINIEGKCTEKKYFNVLFYGQYIPLHGIEYIVRAAKILEKENIKWVLIGDGQEKQKIVSLISALDLDNVELVEWVAYDELLTCIHGADLCLGIFGETNKAQLVIPNKVFQVIAAGKPLVTGDSPAIRELIVHGYHDVILVDMANPDEIARAVIRQKDNCFIEDDYELNLIRKRITSVSIGRDFASLLNNL